MPAPKGNTQGKQFEPGNTAAAKWTPEKAQDFINRLVEIIEKRKNIRTVSEAATEAGGYENLTNYLLEKYEDTGLVDFEPYKKAKDIAKNRLINDALDGEANATLSIFLLKNCHGYKDKIENTHEIKGEQPLFGDFD